MSQKADDSLQVFKKFIIDISHIDVAQHLQKAEQMYAVREFKVSQLSTVHAQEIYQNIYIKFNRNMIPKTELNWWENELRIFVWVLILYVEAKNTKIQQLTEKDWQFFSLLFPHKKEILFEYQSINILKEHGQAKKWVQEEDQLFSQLVNEKGLKCKWSELAKLLYIESEKKFFRTPKQCRQRWLNHLDPAKSKSQWSIRQDYVLIRYVYEKEKRWAEISKLLQNKRNEHSIKNRFKSLITKEQKFHKQKLQESQLITFVYKRYTSHFTKLNTNRSDQIPGFLSPTKNEGEKKPSSAEQKLFQQVQENLSRNSQTIKAEPQKLMFPFSWHPKHKEAQNFVPFRGSREFLTCNSFSNPNEKELRDSMVGTNITSMEGFPGFFTPHGTQISLFPKFKSENILQKRNSYLSEQGQNQKHQIQQDEQNKFSDMLDEKFCDDEYLPLGENFQRFLPQMMNDLEDQMSLENRFNSENYFPQANLMDDDQLNKIDEEEKQIRAQIFLTEEPFELLRDFFYKKKLGTEIKQKA